MTYALVIFINGAMTVMGIYPTKFDCESAKMDLAMNQNINAKCVSAN